MAKTKITREQIRLYNVLYRAVSEGVNYGWQRAHKHQDDPDVSDIKEHIISNIMNSLDE